MRQLYIAPSLLAADKNNFKNEIDKVIALGVNYIHFDVMDKLFIGHESFSYEDFNKIKDMHNVINDVHLMVKNPYIYAKKYSEMGANFITFHYEALKSNEERIDCIEAIKRMNVKVGISIKPKTNVDLILPYLHLVDLVLIMSVEPGLGGQSFMDSSLEKIKKCREFIDQNKLKTLIEVDGGLNNITGEKCYKAGADILVMGTYLFGHDDIKLRYEKVFNNINND